MAYYKSGGINVTSNSNVSINTASGSIASFNTNLSMPVLETKATINPIQNGTPWIDSNVVNKEPYIKRAVAGTAARIGNHLYDKLVGGTVAFNQLCNNGGTRNVGNVVGTLSNGVVTIQGTNTEESSGRPWAFPAQDNNVILFLFENPTVATKIRFYALAGRYFTTSTILKAAPTNGIQEWGYNQKAVDSISYTSHVSIINLTAMFGSTIADYIYSLEQGTAGAGVAWLKSHGYLTKPYYAYNAGELMSVKATAHVMKNASNTVIGNYALDSNLELRGIPKLDANNKLYYDGDEYTSDGNVLRKYGIVDFGTLAWEKGTYVFYADLDNAPVSNMEIVCAFYSVYSYGTSGSSLPDKHICAEPNGRIYVNNSAYTNKADFKTAMSGVYLVYELATPTEETADPFTNPQVCDENGTEEYTDSRAVAIPVGHETYQANICPITGFDELNIQRTGVNLWDEEWENGSINTTTGVKSVSKDTIRPKNNIKVISGVRYNFTKPTGKQVFLLFYDINDNVLQYSVASGDTVAVYNKAALIASSASNRTFTPPENTAYMLFRCDNTTTYNNDISVNYPSSDTNYHAYNGDTVTIAFGQTVYGGTLDVTRGKLTVTHGCDSAVLSDYTSATPKTETIKYTFDSFASNTPIRNNSQLCNIAPYAYNTTDILHFYLQNSKQLVIYLPNDTPLTAIIQVYYELATPIEIDLTPVQIRALVGENNVYADCNGDTEVKYRKVNTQ